MKVPGTEHNILDDYVPVGAHSFTVDSTDGLSVGDTIIVHRPSPTNWIHDINMDQLQNPWTPGSKDINWDRVITSIHGNQIRVDAPLTTALEQLYGGGTVYKYSWPGRIENDGIENMRGVSDFDVTNPQDEDHAWDFIRLDNLQNAWVRSITAEHFAYAAVNIERQAKWVTVDSSSMLDPISQITGGRRYSFNVIGQLILVKNSYARNGRHDFVLGSTVPGPNVFFNCFAEKTHDDRGPHHRWSSGALFDNLTLPDGKINVRNRGNLGSGHGWAGANDVIWNSTASSYIVESPQTAQNWIIGSFGRLLDDHHTAVGPVLPPIIDSPGCPVTPQSLYQQLAERLAGLEENSPPAQPSQWVFVDSNGKLVYNTLPRGDHIMDFSWAGYMGGGVTLPSVPVEQSVTPSGDDDTSSIQSAIDSVAALVPDANGFRGAVLLAPGTFNISSTLRINASGVVLRGSGTGDGGTIINMTGDSGFLAISMRGSGSFSTSNTANITDSYVPSGTYTVTVNDASNFSVGDSVLIRRPVTQDWIHFMGMDTLVRDGQPQTWLTAGSTITTDRVIQAISDNRITFDAPLTDSFDSTYLGSPVGTVSRYTFGGRISQDGVEHLTIQSPAGTTIYNAVTMDNIIDSWIQDVVGQETQNAFNVNKNAKRITLDGVINNVSTTQTRAAGTADFAVTGTQILVNQCQSNGTGGWPLVTQATGTGPIAILNFSSTQRAGISPHQRWTTRVLSDNGSIPNAPKGTPGVAYRNRATAGSGHGWTTGWSVAWNVTSPWFLVSAAPGTENWCIGCVGSKTSTSDPDGIFESLGAAVSPPSLYLAQLCERLGPAALANIGYSSDFCVSPPRPDFVLVVMPEWGVWRRGN